jgi:hypothetical protein
MKTVRLVCCVALALGAGAASFEARACGVGFHIGIGVPCLSFGVGVGLGCGFYGCSAWDCGYYGYRYPAYGWNPAPAYVADPPPAPAPAPPAPSWVPRAPGAGHWVPEPQPYRYTPETVAAKKPAAPPAAQTVTVTRMPGGVPVYHVELAGDQR